MFKFSIIASIIKSEDDKSFKELTILILDKISSRLLLLILFFSISLSNIFQFI